MMKTKPIIFVVVAVGCCFFSAAAAVAANGGSGLRGAALNNKDENDNARRRRASTRIIGGTVAPPTRYPYFVSLRRKSTGSHYCGASLIAPNVLLSAAHCGNTGSLPLAIIGRSDFTNTSVGEEIAVVEEMIHPQNGNVIKADGSEGAAPNYDFMLLFLERPVTLDYANFVKLNPNPDFPGLLTSGLTAIGHGYTETDRVTTDDLMEVGLFAISNAQCKESKPVDSPWSLYGDLVTDTMICAEGVARDSCQGDSGGPLVVKGDDPSGTEDFEVGIVSWGYGCGQDGYPGVYARVSAAYDWIRSEICTRNGKLAPGSFDCPETPSMSPSLSFSPTSLEVKLAGDIETGAPTVSFKLPSKSTDFPTPSAQTSSPTARSTTVITTTLTRSSPSLSPASLLTKTSDKEPV